MAFRTGKRRSFNDLKKVIQQRPELTKGPAGGAAASVFSALTPTEFALLFPKYYQKGMPDVGGFREAISRKERKQMGLPEKPGGKAGGETGGGGNSGAIPKSTMMKYAMDQLRKEGVPEANLRAAAAHLVGQAYMESEIGRAHV